ncbi:MAG: hypothetical protein ACLFRG_15880 [Desulfococcaceae bacterium]
MTGGMFITGNSAPTDQPVKWLIMMPIPPNADGRDLKGDLKQGVGEGADDRAQGDHALPKNEPAQPIRLGNSKGAVVSFFGGHERPRRGFWVRPRRPEPVAVFQIKTGEIRAYFSGSFRGRGVKNRGNLRLVEIKSSGIFQKCGGRRRAAGSVAILDRNRVDRQCHLRKAQTLAIRGIVGATPPWLSSRFSTDSKELKRRVSSARAGAGAALGR